MIEEIVRDLINFLRRPLLLRRRLNNFLKNFVLGLKSLIISSMQILGGGYMEKETRGREGVPVNN